MKEKIQQFFQSLFGFSNYLFIFSLFKIKTIRQSKGEQEFVFFLDLIRSNDTILDIGANVGIMTVLMAKKASHGFVYAFEPIPPNLNALHRIVRFFEIKNIKVYPYALGDENKKIEMVMPEHNHIKKQGMSHVVMNGTKEKGDTFFTEMKRLDDLDEISQIKIDIIKIDVENYEYFVLRGGEHLIRKNLPVIFCELWKNEVRSKVLDMLSSMGYQPKLVHMGKLVDPDDNKYSYENFIFIHPERKVGKQSIAAFLKA